MWAFVAEERALARMRPPLEFGYQLDLCRLVGLCLGALVARYGPVLLRCSSVEVHFERVLGFGFGSRRGYFALLLVY